jgi:3-oxoadipyl-CoA thiolase
MTEAFICDAVRTPIGRYGGGLSRIRADDLGAVPLKALLERNPGLDPQAIEEVFYGCANQSGEDNRNVARMSLLLAGLPAQVPGVTLNRLCASGLEAVGQAARAIRLGEMDLAFAGGVESMTRAPFVMGKADTAFGRGQKMEDTTMGWRFVNPALDAAYGTETMPRTARMSRRITASAARIRMPLRCAASSAWQRRRLRASMPRRSCRSTCPVASAAR